MPPSRPSLALLSSATARDARTRRGHNPRHSLETACAHARKPPGVHTATASAMHVPGVAFRAQRRIEPAPPPSPVHPPGSATTRAKEDTGAGAARRHRLLLLLRLNDQERTVTGAPERAIAAAVLAHSAPRALLLHTQREAAAAPRYASTALAPAAPDGCGRVRPGLQGRGGISHLTSSLL
eukprot:Tamp_19226.p1 GENE.Tamp_19226~~Tamp_19226.p1  ORF type:complete len:181 (-),score=14.25 Tamp_19226:49-591(-)